MQIPATLCGPTGMRCRKLVERNGCDNYSDCENESDGPDANLVLNSSVSLNNVGSPPRVTQSIDSI